MESTGARVRRRSSDFNPRFVLKAFFPSILHDYHIHVNLLRLFLFSYQKKKNRIRKERAKYILYHLQITSTRKPTAIIRLLLFQSFCKKKKKRECKYINN